MTVDANPSSRRFGAAALLSMAALGTVFGDIGTSPLYAMGLLFSPTASLHLQPSHDNVLGVLSMVFWLITAVVTVKYASLVLRADNDGEGGIVALFTLLREKLTSPRATLIATVLGLAGASLFLGDAVITPAISILSAVEGAEVVSPSLTPIVVPLVLLIVVGLFAVQRLGTSRIAALFGPVMLLWFGVLAVVGIAQVAQRPAVLAALNPFYGLRFATGNPGLFLAALAVGLLAVTGAEALYSDLGHFGRPAIVRAWLFVAFPALALNYFGQGAALLGSTVAPSNLFYSTVPSPMVLPLTLLAAVATVIAAQAVISGAFSLTSQATKLALLPRIRVRYPSGTRGQVYVAFINWALLMAVVVVVLVFPSSAQLADAYGLSVVGCMGITTVLFFTLASRMGVNRFLVLVGAVFFLTIDLLLLLSCLPKLLTGGWFALLIAAALFTSLWIWHVGVAYVTSARRDREGSLPRFIKHVTMERIPRLPTTAVYLHTDADTVPLSMRATVERFGVLHDHALLVSVVTADVPHVDPLEGVRFDSLGADDGIWFIELSYGFNDRVNLPDRLQLVVDKHPFLLEEASLEEATWYVSRFDIGFARIPGLPGPLGRAFKILKNAAADPVKFYKLPLDRTVTMSSHIT